MFKRNKRQTTAVKERSEEAMKHLREGLDRGLHSEPVEKIRSSISQLEVPQVRIEKMRVEKKRKRRPYLLLLLVAAGSAIIAYLVAKKMADHDREGESGQNRQPWIEAARKQAGAVEHVAADDGELAMGEVHHPPGLVQDDDAGGEQGISAGQNDDRRRKFHVVIVPGT